MDKWVLDMIHFGYTVEILSPPPQKPPSQPFFRDQSHEEIL